MKILATIHFLDGLTLEKEFTDFGRMEPKAYVHLWLRNTYWVELTNNTFLPASQIAKVTWKEVQTE